MTATTWHLSLDLNRVTWRRIQATSASFPLLPPKSYHSRMASTSLCAACRQVFRLHLGRSLESYKAYTTPSIANTSRPFSTSRIVFSSQTTLKAQKSPPAKTVTEEVRKASPSQKESPGPRSTAGLSIAKELRKRASSVTETYVAYGVCENLVKECARQADYTIPQAHEKNIEVPKTKDGEDLGVGTGWWFDSETTLVSRGKL